MSTARPGSAGYVYRHGWVPVAGTGAVDKRGAAKQLAKPAARPNPDHAEATQKAIEKHMAEVEVTSGGKANEPAEVEMPDSGHDEFHEVSPDDSLNSGWLIEDSAQQVALKAYTGYDAYDINEGLRGDGVNGKLAHTVTALDLAFQDAPPLASNIEVSRFIEGDGPFPSSPPPMEPGAEFQDAAFVSTSKLRSQANDFGRTEITVRVPKGSRVIDVNHASPVRSEHPKEQEVLLPRGSRFRVVEDSMYIGKRRIVVEVI